MATKKKKRKTRRKVGRPAGARAKDTQGEILDAAERIFAEVGFEGARLQEIADKAGVTKAMVHYYYESKEKLYQAVLDRVLFELIKLVQDVTTRGGTRIEQLDLFINEFFDYVARHPNFSRLGFAGGGAEARYFDTIVEFFGPVLTRGAKFVNKGVSEGLFKPVDPQMLFFAMYNCITGYFADARFISLIIQEDANSQAKVDAARENLRQMFFGALGVDVPPAQPRRGNPRSTPRP